MKKIFYTAEAYISTYAQGTDLVIIKSADGTLYGASFEFDICTKDIIKAAIGKNETFNEDNSKFTEAEWVEYTDDIGTVPASWLDITTNALPDIILGYQLEGEATIHHFES
jgi:hypothetical protein